ncbi:MAG: DUF3500 domain-containing protein, partial [Actinomycetota bacterium]
MRRPPIPAATAATDRDFAAEAEAFLDTLDGRRLKSASLPFDSAARFDWHYIPRRRPGLHLRDMDAGQRRAALRLVRTALSEHGYATAQGIMALEEVLKDEAGGGDYDAGNFALAVFGTPEAGPPWGWRVDGHHLSLTFTVAAPGTVTVTPHFMGANPAAFRHGARRIHNALGAEEDLARAVIRGLDARQQGLAVLAGEVPDDIVAGPGREDSLRFPAGLPLARMSDSMRDAVVDLVEVYARRLRPDLADAEMERLQQAGVDRLHFAWAGGLEPGQPHYYRIHGPTLLIEYDISRDD